MRTASSSLLSVPSVARILLATVVLGLGLAAAALLQPQTSRAADPIWACYSNSNHSLRSVTGPSACVSGETAVRLDDSNNPIWICLHPQPGHIRFAGPASADPITGNCWGAGSTQYFQVPGDTAVTLCVQPPNGVLSYPPCGSGQTTLVIPPRNRVPVAADQNASVDEDDSVVVQLSATDADGNALTFAITQNPANGDLSAITGTSCTGTTPNTCTANVTYTPDADYFGPDSFTYVANDGSLNSNTATVSITVDPVNDAPSFTSGGDVTVDEDSGAYSAGWATGVSTGPANENGQTLTFVVTNDNNALFSAQPAVSAAGVLTFTPADDANGAAQVDVFLQDDGGTANGGVDTSGTQTFTITVNAVNDRPTFAIDGDQTVDEDAGPQSVPGFAHDFDAGPPDEDATQTVLDYKVSTDDDDLFSVQPDIADDGTLTYTPADNANGVATIRVRVQDDGGTANGGEDTSEALEFTITINAVNDAPVITTADDTVTTPEDTPLVFSSGNGNLISVADVDAGSGEIAVSLTVDHGTLTLDSTGGLTFSTGNGANDAAMTFTGTLDDVNAALSSMTYSPAPDYNGPDTLAIDVDDQGNTGTGGALTDSATVSIDVTAVNDAPTDIALSNTTIDENVAANFVVGTFSTTDLDVGDTFTYTLVAGTGDTDNGAFNILGSDLRITNSPNFEAQSSYSIRVQTDDGNGGTFQKVFTITITDLNEAPIAGTDNYDAIGNTQLRINTPTGPAVSVAFTSSGTNPLANDTDPDTNPAFNQLQISAAGSCTKGGTLTLNAADQSAGRLTYLPAPGIESANASDTDDCTYTLSDGTTNVSGTVKVRITDLVWYVDNSAAAGGDGRSTAVYNSLAPLTTGGAADALDNANDYIFVFQGNANYTGGLVLETGQRLFGQPNGLTVGATALIAAGGSNPTLTNSGGAGITLANGVDVERINVTNTSGAGVAGTAVTSATIGANTSITNTGGNGFDLSGAAGGTVSVGASISNTGGKQVSIQNRTSGSVTFSAAVSGTGTGVALASNTGATIAFSGGVTLSTGANNAFSATGGGTVEVTGSTNTIVTTTGTALTVTDTAIGANDLTFRSIDSTGSSANAGVVLTSTGTAGGLTVTGTGAANSGGTIANKTGGDIQSGSPPVPTGATNGVGFYLSNTAQVSLTSMHLQNFSNYAIFALDVTDFTLVSSTIDGTNGNSAAFDEASVFLANGGGSIALTSVNVSGGYEDNLSVLYNSGTARTATYNVTGSTFRDLQAAGQNSQVKLISTTASSSSSNVAFNFTGADVFENDANTTPAGSTVNWSDGILVTFEGPFQHALTVQNATFHHLFQGLDIASGFNADVNYVFTNNSITFTEGVAAIAMGTASTATSSAFITALIQGNTIGTSGVAQSGSRLGMGIVLDMRGNETAQMTLHGNTIQRTDVNGIRFIGDINDGDTDLRITNNIVREIEDDAGGGAGPVYGIEVTTNTTGSYDVCLNAQGNDSANLGAHDIRVRQAGLNNTFAIQGLPGPYPVTVAANVESYLAGQNPASTVNVRTGGSVVSYTERTCTTPATI